MVKLLVKKFAIKNWKRREETAGVANITPGALVQSILPVIYMKQYNN